MDLPTLSVLLPNYNHARFIGNALNAMLAQSVQPLEIIVVDDGSTDDSLAVIEGLARYHAHIRVLRNEVNQGVNASLNRALSVAKGDYIYGAAADDQVLPGFFERSLWMLAQHPRAAVCCSYPSRVDAVTGEVSEHAPGWSARERYFSPTELAAVMGGHAIAGHTAIVRRDLFTGAGGWIGELQWFTDWYALQVSAFRGGACFIPATLALFRSSLISFYSTGVRNRELQFKAIENLLRRLQSPACCDVVHLFQQSGVLGEIGLDAVRVLALHRDLQSPLLVDLLRPALFAGARQLLKDIDPEVRRGTAVLLGEIGRPAWRALPYLVAGRDDPHPQACRAACAAIGQVLGPVDRLALGLPGRLVVGTFSMLNQAKQLAKQWLKPIIAGVYRGVNTKLYGHLGRFEANLAECHEACLDQEQRLAHELKTMRKSIEATVASRQTRPAAWLMPPAPAAEG
jgi:hypothetical protein